MARPYVPPGVTITEASAPQVTPLVASTSELAIVGLSTGHITRTDQVRLEEDGGTKEGIFVSLPSFNAVPGSVWVEINKVASALNPGEGEPNGSGFGSTSYEINTEKGEIRLVSGKQIKPGTLVNVTYTYVPGDFFNPQRFFNFNQIQSRFGQALSSNGVVLSPLSLSCQKAFEAGAESIIVQPLIYTEGNIPLTYNSKGFITNGKAATLTQNHALGSWVTSLEALQTVEVIDLLTVTVGQGQEGVKDALVLSVIKAVLKEEQRRKAEEQFCFGVFGEDSTGTEALMATIRATAGEVRNYASGEFASQNIVLNVGNFGISLPESNGEAAVGGQYAAAAFAGAMASKPVSTSMTRKAVPGFTKVNDLRTPQQKNEDASEGLAVIEQISSTGQIRCRHSITTDNAHGAARRESSVVRAKFTMIESIRNTLENQIIGQIIADANSPIVVRSAIVGVLSALQSSGDLVDFTTPVCVIASLEPTTITASFSYRPAFTLNYVDIVFGLDLSSQTVSLAEASK